MRRYKITFTVRDAKNKLGLVSFWSTDVDMLASYDTTPDGIEAWCKMISRFLDGVLLGKIEKATISWEYDLEPAGGVPGFLVGDAPLKTAPYAAADVEEKAAVIFQPISGDVGYRTELPAVNHDSFYGWQELNYQNSFGFVSEIATPLSYYWVALAAYINNGSNQTPEIDQRITNNRGQPVSDLIPIFTRLFRKR